MGIVSLRSRYGLVTVFSTNMAGFLLNLYTFDNPRYGLVTVSLRFCCDPFNCDLTSHGLDFG